MSIEDCEIQDLRVGANFSYSIFYNLIIQLPAGPSDVLCTEIRREHVQTLYHALCSVCAHLSTFYCIIAATNNCLKCFAAPISSVLLESLSFYLLLETNQYMCQRLSFKLKKNKKFDKKGVSERNFPVKRGLKDRNVKMSFKQICRRGPNYPSVFSGAIHALFPEMKQNLLFLTKL